MVRLVTWRRMGSTMIQTLTTPESKTSNNNNATNINNNTKSH